MPTQEDGSTTVKIRHNKGCEVVKTKLPVDEIKSRISAVANITKFSHDRAKMLKICLAR